MSSIIKNKKKIGWLVCFLIYSVITFIGVIRHEMWLDEGQAWCIIRDNNIFGIVDMMKYEGHPLLWYFILLPVVKSGVSAGAMGIISWGISLITIFLILWKAPFNNLMKISIVFSSGFLFYNSVISRIYCVISLILTLIAILYHKRKQHPILFGILVGLLANTHYIMSGLVGGIGLFMIYDLITDWKANNKKQNILNLIGLLISGISLLLLLLPTIGSLFVSKSINDQTFTLMNLLYKTFTSFYNVIINISFITTNNILDLFYFFLGFIFILYFIWIKRYKREFYLTILFIIFFFLTTQILYSVMIPNRAYIFIFTLFILLWIVKNNYSYEKKECTGLYYIILFLMIFSIPRGVIFLYRDITGDFTLANDVASYIDTELPDDAIIVTDYYMSSVSALVPNTKIYSIPYQKFVTYNQNRQISRNINWAKVYDDLKDYRNVYYIMVSSTTDNYGGPLFSRKTESEELFNLRSGIVYSKKIDSEYFVHFASVKIFLIDVVRDIKPLIGKDVDNFEYHIYSEEFLSYS